MQEYLLDDNYEFDVTFQDKKIFGKNAFGKLELSQNGIIIQIF